MNLTLPPKWNAEEELEYELNALQIEISSYESTDSSIFAYFEKLSRIGDCSAGRRSYGIKMHHFGHKELQALYFKYPILVWIYLREFGNITHLFAYNSTIFYIAGELPKESFWRPSPTVLLPNHRIAFTESKEPSPFKKYTLLGEVPYLECEIVDTKHIQTLKYHFSGTLPKILNLEEISDLFETVNSLSEETHEISILYQVLMRTIPETSQEDFYDQITISESASYDMAMLQYVAHVSEYPKFDAYRMFWNTEAAPNLLKTLYGVIEAPQRMYFGFIVTKMLYVLPTSDIVTISEQLKKITTPTEMENISKRISEMKTRGMPGVGARNIATCRLHMYFNPNDMPEITFFGIRRPIMWDVDVLFIKKVFELCKYGNVSSSLLICAFFHCTIDRMKGFIDRESSNISQLFTYEGDMREKMPLDGNIMLDICLQAEDNTNLRPGTSQNIYRDYLELIVQCLQKVPIDLWDVSVLEKLIRLTFDEGVNPIAKLWADTHAHLPKTTMEMFILQGNIGALRYAVETLDYDIKMLDPIWVANLESICLTWTKSTWYEEVKEYIVSQVKSSQ